MRDDTGVPRGTGPEELELSTKVTSSSGGDELPPRSVPNTGREEPAPARGRSRTLGARVGRFIPLKV